MCINEYSFDRTHQTMVRNIVILTMQESDNMFVDSANPTVPD